MNTEQPETLAAILAEMREAGRSDEHADGPLIEDYADRIEAAAERETRAREQAAADYALKRGEDIHADRCRNCTERAPGNAAALREALEFVLQFDATDEAAEEDGLTDAERIAEYADHIEECQKKARAALASPARNCDRFATAEDAMEEWNKYPQSRYKGCRVCPHGDASMVSPAHLTLAEWLFVTAEGKEAGHV